jgi:phosphohistidine phosphatase SixA
VEVIPELGGPMDLADVEELLSNAGDPVRPVLVGHDPDFTEMLGELVAAGGYGGAAGLRMRKGAIACIAAPRPLQAGTGDLRWLVPPELLARG